MNKYQQYIQTARGLAFIIAPLFLALGALVFLLGIGLNPGGYASWVEGMFMGTGFLILVPVYMELARRLGQKAPKLAVFCGIGALGLVFFGIIPAFLRITQAAFIDAGMELSAWHASTKVLFSHSGWTSISIWAVFGLLSSILVGVGFVRYGGLPRWTAVLLILSPILLLVGQGGDETIAWWQYTIFYPLAMVTWLVALAPIGWRYLRGPKEEFTVNVNLDPTVS